MAAHEQTALPFRNLPCRRCRRTVPVLELPDPYIDERDFLCGDCAKPVATGEAPVPYDMLPPGF